MLNLTIDYEEGAEHPLEYSDWKVVPFECYDDMEKYLKTTLPEFKTIGLTNKYKAGTLFMLSRYEHSGVQWGLKGEVHQCRFDTTHLAGLLIYEGKLRELPKEYKARKEIARDIMKRYTQWCNGEVYSFMLTDGDEQIDACCGWYDTDEMLDSIISSLEGREVEVSGDAAFIWEGALTNA
jgi:hypothetical protein